MSVTKQFNRIIESMGNQLVLTKISMPVKPLGLLYHQLFERNGKPSLDIALDPKEGTIVYVTFILQDDPLTHFNVAPVTRDCEIQFKLPTQEITTDNYHHFSRAEFIVAMCTKDLWILRKDIDTSLLECFPIDDKNKLLFKNGIFAGIVFEHLNDYELNQLHISGYNCDLVC